jgi:hypothetical protein
MNVPGRLCQWMEVYVCRKRRPGCSWSWLHRCPRGWANLRAPHIQARSIQIYFGQRCQEEFAWHIPDSWEHNNTNVRAPHVPIAWFWQVWSSLVKMFGPEPQCVRQHTGVLQIHQDFGILGACHHLRIVRKLNLISTPRIHPNTLLAPLKFSAVETAFET